MPLPASIGMASCCMGASIGLLKGLSRVQRRIANVGCRRVPFLAAAALIPGMGLR